MTGTIRVGERPVGIALDTGAGLAFTANADGGDLSVIDLGTGVVLYALPVPGRPSAVAADGDGVVYVADGEGRRVYGIDVTTGERTASFKVGRHPRGLAVDADLGRLYVAVGDGVSVLDTRTGARLDRLALPGVTDLAVDPDTHELWLVGAEPGTVSHLDPATGDLTVLTYGDAVATGLDVDGHRNRLYLATGGLRELDLDSGELRGFAVDGRPTAVRVDPHSRIAYLVDPEANLVTALGIG
ncbi:MAG: YncE family protein [Propionicimonas sp.]|nr:YncE family protein [Propionicimonas sp.]